MEINGNITIGELKQLPELKPFAEFLIVHDMMPKEELDRQSLGEVGKQQTDAILEGMKRLLELVRSGIRVSYDYWSPEEKERNPEKKRTNLFFFPGEPDRPYIIVCAGGAYQAVCNILEGFPAAARWNRMGYPVFVLTYRVTRSPLLPAPQEDLAQAVRYIRDHAEEFRIWKDDYAVCGFSAGGHLAASWGTDHMGYQQFGLPAPGALLLAYPAASVYAFNRENPEAISYINTMIGRQWTTELFDMVSAEKHMSKAYPPTYLIHCQDDDTVPVHTSELQVEKYQELGIPYRFRKVRHCGHGFGTGDCTEAQGWQEEAAAFWEKQRNNRWFHVEKIREHITRITGAAGEMMYLVEGDEKAALIDTGAGVGKLADYVKTLTDKPVIVLLSHGHLDHAMAGYQFDEVYMSPEDQEVYREHSKTDYRIQFLNAIGFAFTDALEEVSEVTFHPIYDEDKYDLGNLTIQAFVCPGHTKGSVVFLLEEERILFLGDACNVNTLVYDWYSTTIEEYRNSLIKVEEKTEGKYDSTIFSHDPELRGNDMVNNMIRLCDSIMNGGSDEEPVQFMEDHGLMARKCNAQGLREDGGNVNIMYVKNRIFL